MFTGLFEYNKWFSAIAGISIILSAVYTLNMVQRVFYGDDNINTKVVSLITVGQKLSLSVIILIIFILGIYPRPVFALTADTVNMVMSHFHK